MSGPDSQNKREATKPTQNIQRVKAEPLPEGANINVITRSGMATGGSMEKAEAELLIRKAPIKQDWLDLAK